MAYQPPTIGAAGLTLPAYQDILNYLIAQYQGIYGQSVYLEPDAADYQDIAIRALQKNDVLQALQMLYLSFNPQTAVGASLDLVGKTLGTPRKAATASICQVTLTGTAQTTITNGAVQDQNGNYWSLPGSVTIGLTGSITVTATCQILGNVTANPGTITILATPTAGWTSVTNSSAATTGQPVESDSQYRARLMISQAKPSLTVLEGTAAAVAAVANVTRSHCYENYYGYTASYGVCNTSGTAVTIVSGYPVDSTDVGQSITINGTQYTISAVPNSTSVTLSGSAGTQTGVAFFIGDGYALGPKNSVTCVVEGGSQNDIAWAIYENRGIGPLANGTTTVSITDPANGNTTMPISFDVLGYVNIYVAIGIHGLTGFTTATQSAIQTGIVNYLNGLAIGSEVVYSEIYGAALTARANPEEPLFSIKSLTLGSQSAQTSASTTSGSPTITVTSATGITTGQTAVGAGIPANTTVSGVSGTTITLSQNATATSAAVTVQFFTTGTTDITVPYNSAALGSTSWTVVNLV